MSLTVCEVVMPSADFGGASTLPSLYAMSNVQELSRSVLDEDWATAYWAPSSPTECRISMTEDRNRKRFWRWFWKTGI